MDSWFKAVIANGSAGKPTGWQCQFYNPADTSAKKERSIDILWRGFPRALTMLYGPDQALVQAERLQTQGIQDSLQKTFPAWYDPSGNAFPLQYRPQPEYLEWYVERDSFLLDENGDAKITRITFTCEAPEYWETLARYRKETLLRLYRRYVNRQVSWEDLVFPKTLHTNNGDLNLAGTYNPWNRWNTTHGIMHLSYPANLLIAEILLVANATVLRKGIGARYLREGARLTCASMNGGPNNASDLRIGHYVNLLTQRPARVSLQIPVALAIDQWDPNIVTDADGKPVPDYFRILRGEAGEPGNPEKPSRILRLEYTVPKNASYVVGDLYVDGKRITSGGQLARHIHMKTPAAFIDIDPASHTPCCDPFPPLDAIGEGWVSVDNRQVIVAAGIGTGAPDKGYEPAFPEDAGYTEPVPTEPIPTKTVPTKTVPTKTAPVAPDKPLS